MGAHPATIDARGMLDGCMGKRPRAALEINPGDLPPCYEARPAGPLGLGFCPLFSAQPRRIEPFSPSRQEPNFAILVPDP